MSSKSFEVDRIVLCEHATQDANGRFIFVGVYDRETLMHEEDGGLPPLFINVSIEPFVEQFELSVEFVGPQKVGLVRGRFKANVPNGFRPGFRLNLAFNMPAMPFPGFGEYRILVRNDADRVIGSRIYEFKDAKADLIQFEMEGSIEINADFLNKLAREQAGQRSDQTVT